MATANNSGKRKPISQNLQVFVFLSSFVFHFLVAADLIVNRVGGVAPEVHGETVGMIFRLMTFPFGWIGVNPFYTLFGDALLFAAIVVLAVEAVVWVVRIVRS